MNVLWLVELCSNATCSKDFSGTSLRDVRPILIDLQHEDALSLFAVNSCSISH
jgi:hypothetical protein